MSLAETEMANVESITRGAQSNTRVGLSDLQRFARAGLDLKIGDFRQLCEELNALGLDDVKEDDTAAIADILFGWMISKLEQDAK